MNNSNNTPYDLAGEKPSRDSKNIIRYLVDYITKMREAGVYVSQKNLSALDNDREEDSQLDG